MTRIGQDTGARQTGPGVARADMVGSLLRPPELLAARNRFKRGEIDAAALREAEDTAVRATLGRLRDIGYPVATDGEMRRDAWVTGVSQAVSGFADEYPVIERPQADGTVSRIEFHTKPVVARLRKDGRFTEREFGFLRDNAGALCPKVTMPSPAYLARACYTDGSSGYASPDELLTDLTRIIREEAEALRADGVGYVQLDEGFLAMTSRSAWESLYEAGTDLAGRLQRDIDAENACHDALEGAAIRAIHICLGNRTSFNAATGSYDKIAEPVFTGLHADRFLLEYDSERSGDFSPLRFVPEGKIAVLGLVTTKDARLEKPADLLRRIDEAARFCPMERLAISPQCGFFHGAEDTTMTLDDQWRKLELIVDVAARAWAG
jgi:5-methyltetrahydropteroyltriglutamate--homocysteine methyltransferase